MNLSLLTFAVIAAMATLVVALSICRPMLSDPAPSPQGHIGRRAAILSALLLPLVASSLYGLLGTPRALMVEPGSSAHRMNSRDMALATDRLAKKLAASPNDLASWFVLARSYQAMERWQDSASAYRQALRLSPRDPDLMADLADVLATTQGGQLQGEPMQWIVQALRLDSLHPKGRALAAMAAYRAGHFDEAMSHWEKLAAVSSSGSQGAALASQGMARIQSMRQAQAQAQAEAEAQAQAKAPASRQP